MELRNKMLKIDQYDDILENDLPWTAEIYNNKDSYGDLRDLIRKFETTENLFQVFKKSMSVDNI